MFIRPNTFPDVQQYHNMAHVSK